MAATLHSFDKQLNRSGWSSLGWGAFSAIIGFLLLSRGGSSGWVNLALGLLLMVEGLYEKRVREPKVIKVSAATLGVLGLWNLVGFVLAIMTKARTIGHPWVAVIQLLGAWKAYSNYGVYAASLAASDPGTNREFEDLYDGLNKADPSTAPDMVEFVSSKFGDNDIAWRARSIDDLMFFIGRETVFGRKKGTSQCFFIPRREVKIDMQGEKAFGSRQKMTIAAGGLQLKGTITVEMANKLLVLISR